MDVSNKTLKDNARQVSVALQFCKSLIINKKLEMLPRSGTVILETVANVHKALQSYEQYDNIMAIISAKMRVDHSLGKLIDLCDQALFIEDDPCLSLSQENVTEVVRMLENALQNLMEIVDEKVPKRVKNGGLSTKPYSIGYSLLDSSPERSSNPPPLPPKKKRQSEPVRIRLLPQQQTQSITDSDIGNSVDTTLLNCSLDQMSLRSKSCKDNSNRLSTSSIDSALNDSDEITLRQDIDKSFEQKSKCIENEMNDSIGQITSSTESNDEPKSPRDSIESGFESNDSARTSIHGDLKQFKDSLNKMLAISNGKLPNEANVMSDSMQVTTTSTETKLNDLSNLVLSVPMNHFVEEFDKPPPLPVKKKHRL